MLPEAMPVMMHLRGVNDALAMWASKLYTEPHLTKAAVQKASKILIQIKNKEQQDGVLFYLPAN